MRIYDYIPSKNELLNDGFEITPVTSYPGVTVFEVPDKHPSNANVIVLSQERISWYKRVNTLITLHNEHGPAVVYDNSIHYYVDNERHRYEGPAFIECRYKDDMYFIRGNTVKEEEYLEWIEESGIDVNNLSFEDKTIIDLRWGCN